MMENDSNNKVEEEAEAVLIRQYQKLLSEVVYYEEEMKQPDSQHVRGYMKDAQQLFAQIKSPKPLCLDAKVTNRMSKIVREQGHQMTSNVINFDLGQYTAKILHKLKMESGTKMRSQSLVKFGKCISSMFRRSPSLTYLYGSVRSQPVETGDEKPARRERVKEVRTVLRETQTLDINQNRNNPGQRDGTEELVSHVFGCLVRQFKKNGRQPVDYFQFITDQDFAKTIENMFHVSFLVKEGRAAVMKGERTGPLPVISPIRRSQEEEEEIEVVSSQVVIDMTMGFWSILAKKYRGRLPMIS